MGFNWEEDDQAFGMFCRVPYVHKAMWLEYIDILVHECGRGVLFVISDHTSRDFLMALKGTFSGGHLKKFRKYGHVIKAQPCHSPNLGFPPLKTCKNLLPHGRWGIAGSRPMAIGWSWVGVSGPQRCPENSKGRCCGHRKLIYIDCYMTIYII